MERGRVVLPPRPVVVVQLHQVLIQLKVSSFKDRHNMSTNPYGSILHRHMKIYAICKLMKWTSFFYLHTIDQYVQTVG